MEKKKDETATKTSTKKSIILGTTLLLLVALILLGLTYAYYRTRIVGNANAKTVSVVSKNLEVKYQNENAYIEASGIEPGYNVTKTFEVTNTGDEAVTYGVKIDNVENTFTRTSDWIYTLTKNGEVIKENVELPSSESYILFSASLASKTTDTYKIEITYQNLLTTDQSEDMGATLSLRLNIAEEGKMTWEKAEEGSLLYAIKNDNEVTTPITIPGKAPSGTTLTFTEGEMQPGSNTLNLSSDDYSSYWIFASGIEFNSEDGTYSLTGIEIMTYSYNESLCLANSEGVYGTCEGYFIKSSSKTLEEAEEIKTTGLSSVNYRKSNAPGSLTYTTKSAATASVTGSINEVVLASAEDDYGTSYYYRGNVENNYVNYSGMCWRIVRVQGDGTIKLALADENGECNADTYSTDNTTSAFVDGNPGIVNGYANDFSATGEISTILTTWMNKKITKEEDKNSLIKSEWCHDTSISVEEDWGDGEIAYIYGAYRRLHDRSNANPTLKCNQTGLNNTSATKINSNIGLMTADELAFAGFADYLTGSNSYLLSNANGGEYWTMSPRYNSPWEGIYMYTMTSDGKLYELMADNWDTEPRGAIRPAIVLRSTVSAITNPDTTTYGEPGTQTNPYVIS